MSYAPRYDEKALLREEIKQLKAQNTNLSGEVQRLHRELQNVPKARLPSVLEKYGQLGKDVRIVGQYALLDHYDLVGEARTAS